MRRHLNTLFVTLEGAYLRKDGAAIEIRHEGVTKLRVPLHNLDGIACFGWDISCSAALMAACAEANVALSFHNPHGKFLAASNGFTSGNILLRREQYRRADDDPASLAIASNMIAAKLANTRHVLMRAARDHGEKSPERALALTNAADFLAVRIGLIPRATSLDTLRGIEGDSAAGYFAVFSHLLTNHDPAITPAGKSRLRRTAKACLDYGQRVQASVFECKVDPAQLVTFKARLLDIIDLETDSLRFYHLGSNLHHKVEHHGVNHYKSAPIRTPDLV